MPNDHAQDQPGHRSGYVALAGKPNVGKSTLMNALVGQKLSIVTAKPQTTRHRVLGIATTDAYQMVFLDTPGIIDPRYGLQQSMMKTVRHAVADADIVLFMADATLDTPDTLGLETVGNRAAILVLNKMDLVEKKQALPLVQAYTSLRTFDEVVPISALKRWNLDTLLAVVIGFLPEGPPLYPPDMVSEHPERFFVAEIVREKIFERYEKEIPYSTQVNIVAYEEKHGDEKDIIEAEIVVERESQKPILIGKGGKAIKALGIAARRDVEKFLGRPVYLRLFVKVRKGWRDSETHLRSFGYE